MGDTQYLTVAAQRSEQATDHFGRAAANTHVYFIKHQRGGGGGLGDHHLYGKADARQFATGSNFGQWACGLSRVGADQELDVFHAMWGRLVIVVTAQFGDKLD